jgi:mono/diheme cytochrome c family protein
MANVGTTVVVIAAFAFVFGRQVAAEVLDPGKAEYHSSCASCHGIDGKGNGPVSADLKVPPSDLTVLAKKNNGAFPFYSVHEIIDGRKAVIAHGIARHADLG